MWRSTKSQRKVWCISGGETNIFGTPRIYSSPVTGLCSRPTTSTPLDSCTIIFVQPLITTAHTAKILPIFSHLSKLNQACFKRWPAKLQFMVRAHWAPGSTWAPWSFLHLWAPNPKGAGLPRLLGSRIQLAPEDHCAMFGCEQWKWEIWFLKKIKVSLDSQLVSQSEFFCSCFWLWDECRDPLRAAARNVTASKSTF